MFDASEYLSTESYVQMVEQGKGESPPEYSAKGLVVQFYEQPVLNEVKSFGGRTVLTLPARDEEGRKKKAEELVKDWGCGATLKGVYGRAEGHGFDDYEVEVEGAGRPIFDEKTYIFIAAPGDNLNVVRRPVWDAPNIPKSDTARFKSQWADYKAGRQQQRVTGQLLEHWPVLTRAQVAELKALHVFTVEQLAELTDEVVGRYQGLLTLKQRAQKHLDAAKAGAAAQAAATENATLKGQMEAMRANMAEMAKAMEEMRRGGKDAKKQAA
ncbi:MAG TPA: hypothetical protein VFP50_15380 [Anaeromyxobacteraceae bacterium]|nr:hypothetical protein [Anaeromyxobacteraceae bacterium]